MYEPYGTYGMDEPGCSEFPDNHDQCDIWDICMMYEKIDTVYTSCAHTYMYEPYGMVWMRLAAVS